MLEYLIETDKQWLCYLNAWGTPEADSYWLVITNKLTSIPLYAFLLYLCFKYFHWKRVLLVLVCIALIITTTDQLANVFKYGFQRLRPCHDETLIGQMRMVICGGKYGFFSAHAASTMATAVFFSMLLKKHARYIVTVLLLWSVVVSYSRIYLGVHFPGDVLVGWFFGILIAIAYYRLLLFAEKKLKI
ncbi:phosphatase PAP2 family protein [Capnocytophaga sp. HP1101]